MATKYNDAQMDFFGTDSDLDDESDLKRGTTNAVVTGTDWTTDTILDQMRKGNIDLSPKFQRREAWTAERKSRYIESLFLGYPVPQLVLAETKQPKGKYIVIDGKQRLLAIRRFGATSQDESFNPLKLTNLEIRKDFNGMSLKELRANPKYKDEVNYYENQPIRTVVIRNWEYEDVLYRIFIRLNTGSLPLSTQELRQALHPGPFSEFSDDFAANSEAIHKALGIEGPDFRMRDVEILFRYFAFSLFLGDYHGNLKDFLDNTGERLNRLYQDDSKYVEDEARRCEKSINATFSIFGRYAFKRWNDGVKKYDGPFNRAVFDVMTYYFKHDAIAKKAIEEKEAVTEAYKVLCKKPIFLNSIQTTTKSLKATTARLNAWGKSLEKTLDIKVPYPTLEDNRIILP